MIFINNQSEPVFPDLESFDDIDSFVDTCTTTFNMVQEMYMGDLENDKLSQVYEASFAAVVDAIKQVFKVVIGEVMDFFRRISLHIGSFKRKVRKFVDSFSPEKLNEIKSKTYTSDNEISYIDDFSICKKVGEVDVIIWPIVRDPKYIKLSEEEYNSLLKEKYKRAYKFMGLNPLDPNADVKAHVNSIMTKKSKSVTGDKLWAVIDFINSNKFEDLIKEDGRIRQNLAASEKTLYDIEKELKQQPDIFNRSASTLRKESIRITKIQIKLSREVMGTIISHANSAMTIIRQQSQGGENK